MILRTTIISCGGLGTRPNPLTRWLPDGVLPAALRPLLGWALEQACGPVLLQSNPEEAIQRTAVEKGGDGFLRITGTGADGRALPADPGA